MYVLYAPRHIIWLTIREPSAFWWKSGNQNLSKGAIGVWGQSQFFRFFSKKYAILSIFWYKFLLKRVFKWMQNVCWCAPTACPTCLPLVMPLPQCRLDMSVQLNYKSRKVMLSFWQDHFLLRSHCENKNND